MAWAASQATATPRVGHSFSAGKRSAKSARISGFKTATPEGMDDNLASKSALGHIFKRPQGFGFERRQGRGCRGGDRAGMVRCALAPRSLARISNWFQPSITEFWMLRIGDNNDLLPAVR